VHEKWRWSDAIEHEEAKTPRRAAYVDEDQQERRGGAWQVPEGRDRLQVVHTETLGAYDRDAARVLHREGIR
jgi:hypothetical protein